MSRSRNVAFLVGAMAAGCSGPAFEHSLPSSPLLAADWPAPFEERASLPGDEGPPEADGGVEDEGGDVRGRMVAAAKRWLRDGAERPERGYGLRDADEILARVIPGVSWDAESGLDDLVSLARERRAYRGDASPQPGDVVLFHNQYDVNTNGAFDDWLTGCAIVLDTDGPRFTAVTRTGHAPRRIVVWPDGPSAEEIDGEKVNSYLRIPTRADPADAEYLASDLYAGYIDVEALEASARAR